MPIQDQNIDWYRKRWYIPAREFGMWAAPLSEASGTGSSQDVDHLLGATPQLVIASQSEQDTTASDISLGVLDSNTNLVVKLTQPDSAQSALISAALVNTEFSSFGFGGFHVRNAGDLYTTYQRVPIDVDPAFEIGVKVNYISGSSTAADIFDWIALLDFSANKVALKAPTSVLDAVIDVAGTLGTATASLNRWSSRGVKNRGFVTRAEIEDGALFTLSVELDSTQSALSSEELHFLGVEIDYVPLKTLGYGSEYDRPLTANPK